MATELTHMKMDKYTLVNGKMMNGTDKAHRLQLMEENMLLTPALASDLPQRAPHQVPQQQPVAMALPNPSLNATSQQAGPVHNKPPQPDVRRINPHHPNRINPHAW